MEKRRTFRKETKSRGGLRNNADVMETPSRNAKDKAGGRGGAETQKSSSQPRRKERTRLHQGRAKSRCVQDPPTWQFAHNQHVAMREKKRDNSKRERNSKNATAQVRHSSLIRLSLSLSLSLKCREAISASLRTQEREQLRCLARAPTFEREVVFQLVEVRVRQPTQSLAALSLSLERESAAFGQRAFAHTHDIRKEVRKHTSLPAVRRVFCFSSFRRRRRFEAQLAAAEVVRPAHTRGKTRLYE